MTVLHRYTHDGTNGATATTANTGYDSESGTGTAPTYTTGTVALGTASINWSGGGSAARFFISNDDARASSGFFRVTANVSSVITFTRKRDASTNPLAQITINTSNKIAVKDGSAVVATSTMTVSNNTWYQYVWDVPGDSTQVVKIYNQAGTTLLETITTTATAGSVGDTTMGQFNGSANAVLVDHHRTATATLHPIQAPTAAFSNSAVAGLCTVTNTSTANTGDGETLTYDWDWGDGSSHSTSANPTHTYATSNTFTITLTVTDSDGQTATVNHNQVISLYTPYMQELGYAMNRLAGTLSGSNPGVPTLSAAGAANIWAGTTGLELVGALNAKAGNARGAYKDLAGVLNQLAGTTGLEPAWAAGNIAS